MKTISKVVVPLIALAALAGMTIALLKVMDIGTCASGGPYVSARPCPDGTGTTILLLTGCIIVYTFTIIGMSFSDFSAGAFWFGLLFVVLGGAFLYSAITGSNGGGVGYFIGPLFILMGVAPLFMGARDMIESVGEDDSASTTTASNLAGGIRPATGQSGMFGPAASMGLMPNQPVATGTGVTPPVAGAPAPAPKAPAKSPPSATEFDAKVSELDALRQAGTLTQAEFEAAKAKLLRGE